jgi:V/A-type H+-transporting ATPase subunit C
MSAYLNTRVSLYCERLWTDEQFSRLIRIPHAEVPENLTRRGLGTLALGYGGTDPISLEGRIIAQMLEETRVLVRPLTGPDRQFIIYLTQRFELSNVKTLLRAKMAGERFTSLVPRLIDMGPFARLDLEDLMHADDVMELFRRLEHTPYADIVRHARRAFEESHDPFILEATLDRAYYEGLVRRAQPIEAEAGKSFRDLMASLIDRINLVWLLRYRFNYDLPPARVYYLLVGGHYRLQAEVLQRLVTQPSIEAVIAALPPALGRPLAGAHGIMEVTHRLEGEGAARARQVLHSAAHPLARAFAYLILRERDLRAVRAILRGRHLGLPTAAIEQALGQRASV